MADCFTARRNALFACLDDANKELGTSLGQGAIMSNARKTKYQTFIAEAPKNQNLSHLRGKESLFKKPERPIGKCLRARRAPDYEVNPHKWKKYSLEDVDISDHTNTAAAFDFLKEMDRQREAAQEFDGCNASESAQQKIEFKRSSKIARSLSALEKNEVADAQIDKPKLRGSKLLMPEYVVGQRAGQRNTKKSSGLIIRKHRKTSTASGTLKLSHLEDEDDDGGDDAV